MMEFTIIDQILTIMKNQKFFHPHSRMLIERLSACLFVFLFVPLFLLSCENSSVETITWVEFEPVYMSMAEFRSAVVLNESRDLFNPGKIYFYSPKE